MSGFADVLEEAVRKASQDNRPPISPTKKAEQHWPTSAHRTDTAPAWPPFPGHRVPLGGGGR